MILIQNHYNDFVSFKFEKGVKVQKYECSIEDLISLIDIGLNYEVCSEVDQPIYVTYGESLAMFISDGVVLLCIGTHIYDVENEYLYPNKNAFSFMFPFKNLKELFSFLKEGCGNIDLAHNIKVFIDKKGGKCIIEKTNVSLLWGA